MRYPKQLTLALILGLFASPAAVSLAEANPCAAKNPCAANPCAAPNPCAAQNPCAANPCGGGGAAAHQGKAVTVVGDILQGNQSGKFVVRTNGKQLPLTLSRHAVVREGPKVKHSRYITPGRRVTVSYVDTGSERTAWYVYLASAGPAANPCGGGNPCAAQNPCAAANPCAAKHVQVAQLNPCAAKTLNPCAAKTLNPCAAKTLNPCAAKTLNPCLAKTLSAEQAKTLNPCAAK